MRYVKRGNKEDNVNVLWYKSSSVLHANRIRDETKGKDKIQRLEDG